MDHLDYCVNMEKIFGYCIFASEISPGHPTRILSSLILSFLLEIPGGGEYVRGSTDLALK